MKAEIISIGDELLIGQTINTNAAFLGERLSALGFSIVKVVTVGDNREALLSAFRDSWNESDVTITTGGLGPTHDDITRSVVVDFFKTRLIHSDIVFSDIEALLLQRGQHMLDLNRDQAMVPEKASIIRNATGTAPGFHFSESGKHFFVTPGVPHEMKGMFSSYIHNVLTSLSRPTRKMRTMLTTGIAESLLAERLSGIETLHPSVSVAYLPTLGGVRLRITADGDSAERSEELLEQTSEFITSRIVQYVYGEGDCTLAEALGNELRRRGLSIAVAESCTGGLVADLLTDTPGSSDYFERGVITYSNRSKEELLRVPSSILQQHGAVSGETAIAMANGIRERASTSIGLSTTGIAGPSGGSSEKPVGLVWIGISTAEKSLVIKGHFGNSRRMIKERAAHAALDTVRRIVTGLPLRTSTITEK